MMASLDMLPDPVVQALIRDYEIQQATDIGRLRSDMNHLLQPTIGSLRRLKADPTPERVEFLLTWLGHHISRLYLALEIMDEAYTGDPVSDERRAEHGLGNNHYPGLAVD